MAMNSKNHAVLTVSINYSKKKQNIIGLKIVSMVETIKYKWSNSLYVYLLIKAVTSNCALKVF